MQKILCRDGKCVDLNDLPCEDQFDDVMRILDCELYKKFS